MKKTMLMLIVLVTVLACGIWKITDYMEFKNNQENLYKWVQTFEVTDIEAVNATIFRENIAPKRYLFTADEAEELLNILKIVPKEAFVQAEVKSLDGISVYICRWKFDETAKSDLLLSYDNGITVLGFTSEMKDELLTAPENENWAIKDEALSAIMERYIALIEEK